MDIVIISMTLFEAMDWKNRVSSQANNLRVLINEGYERQAWRALGYTNWTECIGAMADEFGFSERRLWQLQAANEVEKRLNNCSVGEILEGQLRPLTGLEPEQQRRVWQQVTETPGPITAAKVQAVVDEYKAVTRPENLHVSDDSYEWYTPIEYIEAARVVMGGIDLDPASSPEAQKVINAGEFYTKQQDGLSQDWFGKVWINPPYSMPDVENFADKVILDYNTGAIESAIVLTNNCTDAAWFHKLLNAAGIACLTKGRVKFWGPHATQARQGQVIFYLGGNKDIFLSEFSRFGLVVYVP